MRPSSLAVALALGVCAAPAAAATRQVGPGKAYSKPCAAFAAAQPGDVVEIDAAGNGTYDGDVCAIGVNGLTIRGVNGRAHVDAAGRNAQGKAIWVVQGNDATLENIELSGAEVPDLNGAGVRAEGTNLTIRGCYFHDNQEGILGGAGEVLIETSEFSRNGNCINPAGCAHNLYISAAVTKFTLRYSYSHDVSDGHLVKSRARENYILYNRLTGERSTASYEINLPNAGTSYVIGNLIQQGSTTGNAVMLDYGSEGATNLGSDLYVVNNTFVNERASGGTFVSVASGVASAAVVENNVFFGPGTAVTQASAVLDHNFTGDPQLVNASGFDYHLKVGSPCVDAGVAPGNSARGFPLAPSFEYVHPASVTARKFAGQIDIGAYELLVSGGGAGSGAGGSGAGGSGAGGSGAGGSGAGGSGAGGSGAGGCAVRRSDAGSGSALAALGALVMLGGRWRRRQRHS